MLTPDADAGEDQVEHADTEQPSSPSARRMPTYQRDGRPPDFADRDRSVTWPNVSMFTQGRAGSDGVVDDASADLIGLIELMIALPQVVASGVIAAPRGW